MGKRTTRIRPPARTATAALCLLVAAGLALGLGGCTRRFYRVAADREVEAVLADKDKYPAWKIQQFHVYPDPRSRFADPTNPDRPPMPPDDPAARDLSPTPQKPGRAGIARVEGKGYLELLRCWDAANRAALAAQGPAPELPRPTGADPYGFGTTYEPVPTEGVERGQKPYMINLDQSVELGLINSREYQDQREELYLAALPVTAERFAFAAQFFAIEQFVRQYFGRQAPGGPADNVQFNTPALGFGKLFSTGGLLLFKVANQTVINLSGANARDAISTSNLTLDFIQPFLRGGGRAVTLEPLTLAERFLLYQLRTYARFQKTFYVAIAGGGGGSISGGTFVPTGVIAPNVFTPSAGFGSSGIVPGVSVQGFDTNVNGLQLNPGPSGRLNLATAIPPSVSGYLPTLEQYLQIDIDKDNIAKLLQYRQRYEGLREGGVVTQLQIDQVEQQLLQGRTTLLQDEQQYRDFLDRFKIQLGLPTDTPITLDDSPMRPLLEQFRRFEKVIRDAQAARAAGRGLGDVKDVKQLRVELHRLFTASDLVQGTRFRDQIEKRWGRWEKLADKELRQRLEALGAEHRKLLELRDDLQSKDQALSAADQQRLNEVEFEIDLGRLEAELRLFENGMWKGLGDPSRRRQFLITLDAFLQVLIEAENERFDLLRDQWPPLPPSCVNGVDLLESDLDTAQTVGGQAALTNRFDLMNVRAEVVDAWRQLTVYANALLGVLNVEYRLQSSTPPGQAKPLAFGGSRNQHQLFVNGELPLVRKTERNNYRASLIAYQRVRRALQEAEDLTLQAVRGEIRQLRVFGVNYKIQQRQVEIAYRVIDGSIAALEEPPSPVGQQDVAARAAALTQQLLNAQRSLPTAQTTILNVWTNYMISRLQLYRDLELMRFDNRGVWIDDVATCQCPPAGQPGGRDRERPTELPAPRVVPPGEGPPLGDRR